MIIGIFIIGKDTYTCSNTVDLKFLPKGSLVIAKGCFTPLKPHNMYDVVDCVIKYDNAPAACFKGFVAAMSATGEVHIRLASEITTTGVRELLAIVSDFNLYLLSEKPE